MESSNARQSDPFYRERERLENERRTQAKTMYTIYEQQWSRLTALNELRWDSFPWPTPTMPSTPVEITPAAIRGYILSPDFPENTPPRRPAERVEEYIQRWHPDHLDRGLFARVVEADREMVMEGVWAVTIGLKDIQREETREKQDKWLTGSSGLGDIGAKRREVEMRQRELSVHKMEEAAKRKAAKAQLLDEEVQMKLELARVMEEEVRLKEAEIHQREGEIKRREDELELERHERWVPGETRRPHPDREQQRAIEERRKEAERREKEERRREEVRRLEEEKERRRQEDMRKEEEAKQREWEARRKEEEARRKEEEARRREEERRMEEERLRKTRRRTLDVPSEPDEKIRDANDAESLIGRSSSTDSHQSIFGTTRSSIRKPTPWAKSRQTTPLPAIVTTPPGLSTSSSASPSTTTFSSSSISSTAATSASASAAAAAEKSWTQRQAELAEKQREAFRREQERMETERQARLKRAHTPERGVNPIFAAHERQWEVLNTLDELRWGVFPWPLLKPPSGPHEITLTAINAYIISPERDGAQTTKDRVKEHLRRWHPDRFETKLLGKVVAEERDAVKMGAAAVARSLSTLLTQLNTHNLNLFA